MIRMQFMNTIITQANLRGARALVILAGLFASHVGTAQTTFNWNSASGVDTNWGNYANWDVNTSGEYPGWDGAGDTVVFGSAATVATPTTINNVVDSPTTVATLTYNQTGLNTWNVTQIPSSTTLTVTNNLTVGGLAADSGITLAAINGGGTLLINGNMTVGNPGGTAVDQGTTLDLSGLSNFVFNGSSGTFALGATSGNSRTAANMNFAAASNSVTALNLYLTQVNTSSSASATTNLVNLGAGTNVFNATTLNVGFNRTSSRVQFAGASGGLRVRGVGGTDTDRANVTIGWLNYNGGSSSLTATSSVSLSGHPVDLKLGTLTIAKNLNSSYTGSSAVQGASMSFDTGIMDATAIVLAQTANKSGDYASGTLTIGGGTVIVGTGGITLANNGAGAGPATGTLNITNANVSCAGSIQKVTGGTATLSLIRSSLAATNGVIGTPALPINTLTLGDSTLALAIPLNSTNVVVNTLTPSNTTNSTINLLSFPTVLNYPTTYRLIAYSSGNLGAFALGTVVAPYKGYLVTNSAAASLDFVLTNGPAPTVKTVVWNGNLSGNWDATTANWQGALVYNQNDYVTFDDTANGATNVNLTTTLTPGTGAGLTVSNNAKLYTFTGAGTVGGPTTLTKYGTNKLVLANNGTHTFGGGVNINGGTVQLTNLDHLLPTNGTVSLANAASASLDLNNLNQTLGALTGGGAAGGNVTLGTSGTNTLTLNGAGGTYAGVISGAGAVTKSTFGAQVFDGANTYTGGTLISSGGTLAVANSSGSGTGTGSVTVSGGTLQIGDSTLAGSVAAAIVTNSGAVVFNARNDFTFTNLLAGAGALNKNNTNTVTLPAGNPYYAGGVTINAGTLLVTDPGALGTGSQMTLNADPTACLALAGNLTLPSPFNVYAKTFGPGVSASFKNLSGTNTLAGALFLSQFGGDWIFESVAGLLMVNNLYNGGSTGTKTLWLRGSGNGELASNVGNGIGSIVTGLVKDGTGTWTLTAAYGYNGATTISNGTLVVDGEIQSSPVTVNGGTLRGLGNLDQSVTVTSGGTFAPGDMDNLGTMQIASDLTLQGTTVMRLSASGGVTTNDQVVVLGLLTPGGALNLLLSGTVVGGEVFPLFSAAGFSGSAFSTIQLPKLPGGLIWDTSNLTVNGTLVVLPPRLNLAQAGNALTFSWGLASLKLQAQTNALNLGLTTNWYDYPGGNSSPVSATIDPASPAVFFRLISQ